jgi:hypothetical protein
MEEPHTHAAHILDHSRARANVHTLRIRAHKNTPTHTMCTCSALEEDPLFVNCNPYILRLPPDVDVPEIVQVGLVCVLCLIVCGDVFRQDSLSASKREQCSAHTTAGTRQLESPCACLKNRSTGGEHACMWACFEMRACINTCTRSADIDRPCAKLTCH